MSNEITVWISEEDYKNMNYIIFNRTFDLFLKRAVEESLRALPFVVGNIINQAGTMKDMALKFYDENKDLEEHKDIVGRLLEEAEQRNPGITFNELLKDIAPKARQAIVKLNQQHGTDSKRPRLDELPKIDIGEL